MKLNGLSIRNKIKNGDFNNIKNWYVSNIINMDCMFYKCSNFNQNISKWYTSNIADI